MRVWLSSTVDRILSLRPKRIWEIGCGTGLLLFQIAPKCEYYLGTDMSQPILESLKKQIANSGLKIPGIKLECRAAHDFNGIHEQDRFDMIVLNSVIQYFPDVDYFLTVLAGAIEMITEGEYHFYWRHPELCFTRGFSCFRSI